MNHTLRGTSRLAAATAAAKSEVFLQAIAALKASLQATTAGQEAVKAHATAPRGRQKKVPAASKFCSESGEIHLHVYVIYQAIYGKPFPKNGSTSDYIHT